MEQFCRFRKEISVTGIDYLIDVSQRRRRSWLTVSHYQPRRMSSQLLDTPEKHRWSLTGLADRAWNGACERAISTGWKPIARLAEVGVVA